MVGLLQRASVETSIAAHKQPWVCVAVVLIVAVVTGSMLVAEARMERDHASKEMIKLQQQVEQLSCAVEAERSLK